MNISLSPLLGKIIGAGMTAAKKSSHSFFTPEHLLLWSLPCDPVKNILNAVGCDIKSLENDLILYLEKWIPFFPDVDGLTGRNPIETVGFQSVMNKAVFQCVSEKRTVMDVGDILLSMIEEKNNYCCFLLLKNGTDREALYKTVKENRRRSFLSENNNLENAFSEAFRESRRQNEQKGSALERFCTDMTKEAEKGVYDNFIGREQEINRTIQVLCRRLKNNPIHVGDAGVGKTAITQGLAQRIVEGKVPVELKNSKIYSLDIGRLLAGTKFRGDFEERLHSIIEELSAKKNAILYIDEIHMIMGAGSNGTTNVDAANLLKPVLTNGSIRVIGSTTFEEYSKNFEKDSALARRFQKIDIVEPTEEETCKIIEGLIEKFEKFHNVKYQKSAIKSAVELSVQYIFDKRLPDKAIDVIDEAGAFLKIKDTKQKEEKHSVPIVTVPLVRQVVSNMARVPLQTLAGGEKEKLKNLELNLKSQIFGQDKAIELVVQAVKKSRAGLKNPEKPEASFLFVGPTGVGKTELAKCLALQLGVPFLRYDMSEYQEPHTVSKFVGSPSGYVGYETGGLLTDDVRKNPHSVILFDEIEKAHSDIYNIFLQVLDYGFLTDSRGRKADFRNSIIIMTSNAGARELEKSPFGFGSENMMSFENDSIELKTAVEKEFSPEFRNRLDAIVPFAHLEQDVVLDVVHKEWKKLADRLEKRKVRLFVTERCEQKLLETGYSREMGARNLSRTVEEQISTPLVDEVLFGRLSKGGTVVANVIGEEITFTFENLCHDKVKINKEDYELQN